jgi:AMP nucleosidase
MFDSTDSIGSIVLPPAIHFKSFTDARAAVQRLVEIYERNTAFIRDQFADYAKGGWTGKQRVRAYYPAIRIKVDTYQEVDSRLSYGHVVEPGGYMTTVTQPALYFDYLLEQIGLLIKNHGVPVEIGESDMPIPLHFCFGDGQYVEGVYSDKLLGDSLRDRFDVPELAVTDDAIVNGTWQGKPGELLPLAPFTAPRVDYSLHGDGPPALPELCAVHQLSVLCR